MTTNWIARVAVGLAVVASLAGWPAARAQGPRQQKPFETTYRRPNVSPYLALQQQGYNPLQTQDIYQTQVLPLMEQQRQQIEMINQRRQLNRVQGQVRQIQQSSQARQIDETIRPTGHRSTYMNYSHFYPQQQ